MAIFQFEFCIGPASTLLEHERYDRWSIAAMIDTSLRDGLIWHQTAIPYSSPLLFWDHLNCIIYLSLKRFRNIISLSVGHCRGIYHCLSSEYIAIFKKKSQFSIRDGTGLTLSCVIHYIYPTGQNTVTAIKLFLAFR